MPFVNLAFINFTFPSVRFTVFDKLYYVDQIPKVVYYASKLYVINELVIWKYPIKNQFIIIAGDLCKILSLIFLFSIYFDFDKHFPLNI